MEPLHRLWLGYMSELLGIPLRNATNASQVVAQVSNAPAGGSDSSPTHTDSGHVRTISAVEDGISLTKMQGWQAKLVKADFHGCKIEGALKHDRCWCFSADFDLSLQSSGRNTLL